MLFVTTAEITSEPSTVTEGPLGAADVAVIDRTPRCGSPAVSEMGEASRSSGPKCVLNLASSDFDRDAHACEEGGDSAVAREFRHKTGCQYSPGGVGAGGVGEM